MRDDLAGKTVKLTRPGPGEESARFVVVEDNGDRLTIRLICNLPIPPVELVRESDVVAVESLPVRTPSRGELI